MSGMPSGQWDLVSPLESTHQLGLEPAECRTSCGQSHLVGWPQCDKGAYATGHMGVHQGQGQNPW